MASDLSDKLKNGAPGMAGELSAAQVRAYLRAHPDFLAENSDLLAVMDAPEREAGQGISDFQKFLVKRLRADAEALRAQQNDLISNARANMNTQGRIHSAILFLLDARSFDEFINAITTDLALLLDIDAAVLVVESHDLTIPGIEQNGVRVVAKGTVEQWMGERNVRLDGFAGGDKQLFGPASTLVQSQALIRLDVDPSMPDALLALGSRNPEMFEPGQGTELAQFLGRVVERLLFNWLTR